MNKNEMIEKYLSSLTEIEKKALIIAKKQLRSSFDIEKSNGFVNWIKTI
jgi:hypothetical protein